MSKTKTLQPILVSYITLISIFSISKFPSTRATNKGFTIDLIHRDSPQSPSHDPSLTPSKRLVIALRRSFARVHRFNAKNGSHISPVSNIINSHGEYLMSYSIGTPQVHSLAIVDTGSDTIWTQCKPCKRCFNQTLPFFVPKNSSTYKKVPCKSDSCSSISEEYYCSKNKKNCLYDIMYADGSGTTGELATETITLGSSRGKRVISFGNVVFGCGFDNAGVFDGGESGIVGLGSGKSSLVGQLRPSINGKFSYCLMPLSKASNPSKLNFGDNAVVSGQRVVLTPLVNKKSDTFYYLTLEGISVGNQKMGLSGNSSDHQKANKEGNIVIDSGTTLTFIHTELYNKLINSFKRLIKLKQIKDPEKTLDLCFLTRNDIKIPSVTVHFRGADVKLKAENVFIRTSETALCLAFKSSEGFDIYGSIAQANFLVGYDLEKKTVSFKSKDCSKP